MKRGLLYGSYSWIADTEIRRESKKSPKKSTLVIIVNVKRYGCFIGSHSVFMEHKRNGHLRIEKKACMISKEREQCER